MLTNRLDCLTPGCKRIRGHRGKCNACRQKLSRQIKEGLTTEAEEVAAGRMLPAQDFGRKWNNTKSHWEKKIG